ncbi:hypothetical protein HanPI659440_Chr03g0121441 [Helianthus annuus]|nr:hypothetical protein HanPI659440_Chr03g0121441 [Helianthus annuus]
MCCNFKHSRWPDVTFWTFDDAKHWTFVDLEDRLKKRVSEATNRGTGILCPIKEVGIILDDPKSSKSIKQLEEV